MFTFGKIELSAPLILAPLAGVSGYPFRAINRKWGCEFAFTEMIDTRSLSYGSRATMATVKMRPDDRPLGIQILGEEPEFILKALEKLRDYDFDALDFNAACPTRKVVAKGKGADLLLNPPKLNKLLKLIVQNSPIPYVTVKLRLGWDTAVHAAEIARYAEDAGVKAIFVHGRTKAQAYRGTVDYNAIREVKKAVKVPVIASGDILSAQLAKKMFDETGCDALLVARGALGNPWIFREIKTFLETGKEAEPPTAEDIASAMREHFDMCVKCFKEERGVKKFRKFYLWYTAGFPHIKPLRHHVACSKTANEIIHYIDVFRDTYSPRSFGSPNTAFPL